MIIYLLSPLLSRGGRIWSLCASDRPCIDLYTWRGGDRTDLSTRGAVPFNIQVPTKSSIVMSALSINAHAQILQTYLQASSTSWQPVRPLCLSPDHFRDHTHIFFFKHMDLHLVKLELQGAPSVGITVGGSGNLKPIRRTQCRCRFVFDWQIIWKFILSAICRCLKFLLINRAAFTALTSAALTDSGKVGGCLHLESCSILQSAYKQSKEEEHVILNHLYLFSTQVRFVPSGVHKLVVINFFMKAREAETRPFLSTEKNSYAWKTNLSFYPPALTFTRQ